ncbi:MAG: RNase P subunit p30 family protein, partial [Candidatus Bathyarchaeia archaeon]
AHELGYRRIAVSSDEKSLLQAQSLCDKLGLDLVSRMDLKPANDKELTSLLTRFRRSVEIISIICETKPVLRQASKDHRVDLLNFSPMLKIRSQVFFDRQAAMLASGSNCSYEINVSDILHHVDAQNARLLYIMRLELENAKKRNIPVILSSGAASKLQMREPRGIASLAELIGATEEEGLRMVSDNPNRLVDRNREKLSSSFVSPGVRVVKRRGSSTN